MRHAQRAPEGLEARLGLVVGVVALQVVHVEGHQRVVDEALEELEKDQVVREALGPHVFERFLAAKRLEWNDYRLEVTSWELNKYLPMY